MILGQRFPDSVTGRPVYPCAGPVRYGLDVLRGTTRLFGKLQNCATLGIKQGAELRREVKRVVTRHSSGFVRGLIICLSVAVLASCSEATASPEDVAGTYQLVAVAGKPQTGGAVTLSPGGTFSRTTSSSPSAKVIQSGVYTLSGSKITLDLLNESEPSLRTTTGTVGGGVLEYVPHYQNVIYRYER